LPALPGPSRISASNGLSAARDPDGFLELSLWLFPDVGAISSRIAEGWKRYPRGEIDTPGAVTTITHACRKQVKRRKQVILIVVVVTSFLVARMLHDTFRVRDDAWIRENGKDLSTYANAHFSGEVPPVPPSMMKTGFCEGSNQVCVILGRNPWYSRGVAYSRTGVKPTTWVDQERTVARWERISTNWYSWSTK
jgi:hypothetical protein